MKLTDLEPAAYWAADVIDLELGRAVQQAWHEGVEAATAGHNAEVEAAKAIAARYGGGTQC